jgi:hypothetical protein
MQGFNVSLQENSASWWGGVLDLSGSFKTKNIDLSQVAQSLGLVPPGTRVVAGFRRAFYTWAFGPQFTYRKMSKIQPFARFMVGGAHSDLQPDSFVHAARDAFAGGVNTSSTSFAFIGGGGVDYVWKNYLAFRAVGDYIHSSLFKDAQDNFRISGGIVFRIHR